MAADTAGAPHLAEAHDLSASTKAFKRRPMGSELQRTGPVGGSPRWEQYRNQMGVSMGYPHSWMVFKGKSHLEMDDN